MFKRVTWLTVGFGLGVGATVAGARAVKKQVDRYQPNAMVDRLTDSVAAGRARGECDRQAGKPRRERPRVHWNHAVQS